MAVITPNTNIRLLKLPIDLSSSNQLTFTSEQNQTYYFQHIENYLELENATYMRKDGTLNFPTENPDSIYYYDYCMYQNEEYSDKWFYAYITDVRYLNNGAVAITLETDPYQTWMFDIEMEQSFIEREHVSDDTIGKHTIPEGLETGEFICNGVVVDDVINSIDDLCYILSSTVYDIKLDDEDVAPPTGGDVYNGIYSGASYFRYDTVNSIKLTLELFANHGQIDGITGLFLAPKSLAPYMENPPRNENLVASSNSTDIRHINVDKQTTLNGYTPKNNKLLTGDYNYILATNNNGSAVIYNYEYFSNPTTCGFIINSALCPGCSIRLLPQNYKGLLINHNEGLNMGKLPICNFQVDMYTNWLTQNSIDIAGVTITQDQLNIGASLLQTAGGLTLGGVAGASNITSGLMSVTSSLIQQKQHKLIPPAVQGNLNCGDVITASGNNNFKFYKMSIKEEYAKIIDKYLSAYGYKVNEIKVPNLNSRSNWNFIKTIGANIHGHIPNDDMNKIKAMFDAGITLWHHPTSFLDYSQNNTIV